MNKIVLDVKNRIANSIKEAEKIGFKLIQGDWGSKEEMCGCALSCLLIANDRPVYMDDGESNAEEVSALLGVSTDWVESFIQGFDDSENGYCDTIHLAYELGQQIRQEFKPSVKESK